MDHRGDLDTHSEPAPGRPPIVRGPDWAHLPRQREDVADTDYRPDDPTLPGKMSDTLKRVEIPPDV